MTIKSKVSEFQFQYGAIVRKSFLFHTKNGFSISIPIWCDCKHIIVHHNTAGKAISIPIWCDCKSPDHFYDVKYISEFQFQYDAIVSGCLFSCT